MSGNEPREESLVNDDEIALETGDEESAVSDIGEEVYRAVNPPVDSIKEYLRRISRISILSAEEEKSLARQYAAGDQKAFHRLVESNLRFVVKVAMKYRDIDMNLLDLINEGNIGLIEAAKRFDPERGVRFITYAVWWIKQAIIQAIIANNNTVKLPSKQARMVSKINHAKSDFLRDNGREPTEKELREEYGLDTSNIEDILRATRTYLSIESPVGDSDDYFLKDHLEAPPEQLTEECYVRRMVAQEIHDILKGLDARDAHVIDLRFGITEGIPKTLDEIGQLLHLSKERVRQLEERALTTLRRRAKKRHLEEYLQ